MMKFMTLDVRATDTLDPALVDSDVAEMLRHLVDSGRVVVTARAHDPERILYAQWHVTGPAIVIIEVSHLNEKQVVAKYEDMTQVLATLLEGGKA